MQKNIFKETCKTYYFLFHGMLPKDFLDLVVDPFNPIALISALYCLVTCLKLL
jgi:hypothetical protein